MGLTNTPLDILKDNTCVLKKYSNNCEDCDIPVESSILTLQREQDFFGALPDNYHTTRAVHKDGQLQEHFANT